jgi:hypothetical protein
MSTGALDSLIHDPERLRIVAILAALPHGDALSVTRLAAGGAGFSARSSMKNCSSWRRAAITPSTYCQLRLVSAGQDRRASGRYGLEGEQRVIAAVEVVGERDVQILVRGEVACTVQHRGDVSVGACWVMKLTASAAPGETAAGSRTAWW